MVCFDNVWTMYKNEFAYTFIQESKFLIHFVRFLCFKMFNFTVFQIFISRFKEVLKHFDVVSDFWTPLHDRWGSRGNGWTVEALISFFKETDWQAALYHSLFYLFYHLTVCIYSWPCPWAPKIVSQKWFTGSRFSWFITLASGCLLGLCLNFEASIMGNCMHWFHLKISPCLVIQQEYG